jgi:hypothetical protein
MRTVSRRSDVDGPCSKITMRCVMSELLGPVDTLDWSGGLYPRGAWQAPTAVPAPTPIASSSPTIDNRQRILVLLSTSTTANPDEAAKNRQILHEMPEELRTLLLRYSLRSVDLFAALGAGRWDVVLDLALASKPLASKEDELVRKQLCEWLMKRLSPPIAA